MSEEQTPVETPVENTDTVEQPVSILNDEGKFNQSWRDALPDDLGKHSIWEKYDNPLDLVKGSINAQSQVGKKAEEFWFSEDVNDIAKRKEIMGVPDNINGYDFKIDVPEESDINEESINAFKEFAHDIGLTKEQAQKILEKDIESTAAMNAEYDKEENLAQVEAEAELRSEWKGDKYDYNMTKVSNVMDYLGLEDFKSDPAIGNNINFIKAVFNNIVPMIDNDDLIENNASDNFATITDKLNELDTQIYAEPDTSSYAYKKLLTEREQLLSEYAKMKSQVDIQI